MDAQQRGMLLSRFPNGISSTDLLSFSDGFGKKLRVLELVTPDSVMLIRFDRQEQEDMLRDINSHFDHLSWLDDEDEAFFPEA